MIRVASLDCWHANAIIYQAEGRTDDGLHVYVRYRRPWFSVWVGTEPFESAGSDGRLVFGRGDDILRSDAHPDHDPSSINLATLKAWTPPEVGIKWPDRIDGYANERGGEGINPGGS